MLARAFVWLGGALFVAALTLSAWLYLFQLGRSYPPGGLPALATNVVLFAIFAVHHSLFARDFAKRWMGSLTPDLVRSLYVYAASLLLILVCVAWQPIGGELYAASGAAAAALIAVELGGIWCIARAVARIDPLELAGIHEPSRGEGLQTSGVYRLVRHPIYFGWVLAVFGTPHMTGDRLAFAVMTTAYLAVAVPFEERSLARSFGEAYARYQRDVRWRMIPFIY
jgi:protein-S-isoprenylcysteine O-methyltransferase Ste14